MKKQNIPYTLHESEFINFKSTDSELIFRVAINCGVASNLGIECEFAEKFYIHDIICHRYKMLETNYDESQQLLSKEILDFQMINDKYILTILVGITECVEFIFECESIEWIPIKIVTSNELEELE